MRHAFDTDIFVDVRPMNTLNVTDDAKVQAPRLA
jgi:hypothetical protein